VMVFLNVSALSALKWKKIDPHFRANTGVNVVASNAPSPSARFPGSKEGWEDAVVYANRK
jgi:hypothetical protein